MKSLIICALVFCAALLTYSSRKKKGIINLDTIEKKKIDGELSFDNVIGWFKTLHLNKVTDTPFIANPKHLDFLNNKYGVKCNFQLLENKEYLLLGVYKEKEEELIHSLLIEANSIDNKTKEVLGKEALVVLS